MVCERLQLFKDLAERHPDWLIRAYSSLGSGSTAPKSLPNKTVPPEATQARNCRPPKFFVLNPDVQEPSERSRHTCGTSLESMLMNDAVDDVRAEEARKMKAAGHEILKHTRWCLLKRKQNLTPDQRFRLRGRGRRISEHTEGARQKRKETEVIAGSFPERVWLGFESERTRLCLKSEPGPASNCRRHRAVRSWVQRWFLC